MKSSLNAPPPQRAAIFPPLTAIRQPRPQPSIQQGGSLKMVPGNYVYKLWISCAPGYSVHTSHSLGALTDHCGPAGLSAPKKPGHQNGLTQFSERIWLVNRTGVKTKKLNSWFGLKCCRPSFLLLSTLCHCTTPKREILPSAPKRTTAQICKPRNPWHFSPVCM